MSALAERKIIKVTRDRENNLRVIEGKKPKYRKDGGIKKSGGNRGTGSCEVDPIKSPDDLQKALLFFDKKVNATDSITQRLRWERNRCIFIVGINTALRISDILKLRWKDLMNTNDSFVEKFRLKEKKTGKYNTKFVVSDMKETIESYKRHLLEVHKSIDLEQYMFPGKPQIGLDQKITTAAFATVLNEMSEECGFSFPVGTHTMRKTFSYWYLQIHRGDSYAIDTLCAMLNHDSVKTTLIYAGIGADDIEKAQESVSNFYNKVKEGNYTVDNDKVSVSKRQLIDSIKQAYDLGKAGSSEIECENETGIVEILSKLLYDK